MMMKSSIDAVIVLFILQLFSQLQTKNLEFEHFVYTLETLEKKNKNCQSSHKHKWHGSNSKSQSRSPSF